VDNQKYPKIGKLEKIFHFFVAFPQVKLAQIKEELSFTDNEVLALIDELKRMGLIINYSNGCFNLQSSIDAIDVKYLADKLKNKHIPLALNYFFSLPSTNDFAIKSKKAGIYLCEYQSKGHGKQNAKWLAPIGQAITLSLCYEWLIDYDALQGLNIAIGVAIINTAQKFNQQQLGLKWSNDVFLDNAKVAGILINIQPNKEIKHITIGIGINWNLSKATLNTIEQKCSNINIKTITRTEFIAQLISEVDKIMFDFKHNQLKNILPIWQKHDICQNKSVTITQANKTWKSCYLGVNSQGLVVLENKNKAKKGNYLLASGSISL